MFDKHKGVGYHARMTGKAPLSVTAASVILLSVLSIGLYFSTLSPTISVGDSPELISSAYTLGISHSPGYPLFSLVGKSGTFIPLIIPPAYRINLLVALLGSASVLLLYLSTLEAIRLIRNSPETTIPDVLSAFFCALFLAVSPIFWSQTVIAEVYALNAALFTLLLLISLRWAWKCRQTEGPQCSTTQDSRLLYLIAFLWGLSMGNHHTMIAFGPIFLVFAGIILRKRPSSLTFSFFISSLSLTSLFFLLGLSVYLFLPIRSAENPFMDWGNAEKYSGFMDVILRKQFGLGSRAVSLVRIQAQTAYYFGLLTEQFTIAGIMLGVIGALLFAKRNLPPFLFTLALFIIHGLLTVLILNPDPSDLYSMDVMVIPSFIVFALWIGAGILLTYRGTAALNAKNITAQKEIGINVIVSSILLLIPAYVAWSFFPKNNESGNTFAYDYASDMLQSIEPNGILFVEADLSLFPLWYLQYVEGKRRDVAVLDVDLLMLPWFKDQLKEKFPTVDIRVPDIVKHSKGKGFLPLSMEAMVSYKVSQAAGMLDELMPVHSVYISYEFGVPFKEFGERKDIFLVRNGIIFKVSKDREADQLIGNFQGLKSILKEVSSEDEEVLFVARAYVPSMENMVSKEISAGNKDKAVSLMEGILAIDPYNTNSLNNLAFIYADQGRNFAQAERMVKKALATNPFERARFLKTLGFIYLRKGDFQKAKDTLQKVLEIEPESSWTRMKLKEMQAGTQSSR